MSLTVDEIENVGPVAGLIDPTSTSLISKTLLEEKTDEIASKIIGKSDFPNVAYGSIQAALKREKYSSMKLQERSIEVKQHLKNIDLLLDLSAEISSLPEGDAQTPSEKFKQVAEQLKEQGIHILKGSDKLQKGECKALVSAQIDKERTALQTTITTEIQPEINNINSIMNILQQIIQSDARLKRKMCELPR